MDAEAAQARQWSVELLDQALGALRIGRDLGRLPYDVGAWERDHRQAVNERRDARTAARLYGATYRERPVPGGALPPPADIDVDAGAGRLFQERYVDHDYDDRVAHTRWRTVGHHWDVRTRAGMGTYFTATVSSRGAVEFRLGHGERYTADPAGWTALMTAVNAAYPSGPYTFDPLWITLWTPQSG